MMYCFFVVDGSVLWSEVEDRYLRRLEIGELRIVAKEVEEKCLEGISLFLQTVIKVLSVEMLEALAHSAELCRDFRPERPLCELVDDPNLSVV